MKAGKEGKKFFLPTMSIRLITYMCHYFQFCTSRILQTMVKNICVQLARKYRATAIINCCMLHWSELQYRELTLTLRRFYKGFETTCLAYLHSRKFTLQAKLKNVKPHHGLDIFSTWLAK